jgi:hypothetical protein
VVVDGRFRPQELQSLFAGVAIGNVPDVYLQGEPSLPMQTLNEQLKSQYDWVIWDSPALGQHAEFIELAAIADGVLLVLEADQTKVDTLVFLKERLDRAKANIVGAVINRSGRYLPNKIVRRWLDHRKKTQLSSASLQRQSGVK